jgi:hypothetical protein
MAEPVQEFAKATIKCFDGVGQPEEHLDGFVFCGTLAPVPEAGVESVVLFEFRKTAKDCVSRIVCNGKFSEIQRFGQFPLPDGRSEIFPRGARIERKVEVVRVSQSSKEFCEDEEVG